MFAVKISNTYNHKMVRCSKSSTPLLAKRNKMEKKKKKKLLHPHPFQKEGGAEHNFQSLSCLKRFIIQNIQTPREKPPNVETSMISFSSNAMVIFQTSNWKRNVSVFPF